MWINTDKNKLEERTKNASLYLLKKSRNYTISDHYFEMYMSCLLKIASDAKKIILLKHEKAMLGIENTILKSRELEHEKKER